MRHPILKVYLVAILTGLWLAPVQTRAAADIPPYAADLPAGSHCVVAVAQLRPTQFAVGLKEVEERAAKLRVMEPEKLDKYLRKHEAAIAVGPGGIPYILDGHHIARAVLIAGVKPVIQAVVKENWEKLSDAEFWAKMQEHNYLYLRDENGQGPLDAAKLPKTVEALKDDPYRTLAWKVRSNGGYEKTDVLYADFQWAEFLRPRVPLDNGTNTYDKAVAVAVPLAHSAEARKLPGYSATPTASKE